VPEEAKLTAAKFTLGGLDVEPLLPEDRWGHADVLHMLFERRAVADHVVHVHHYRAMQGPSSARDAVRQSSRVPCPDPAAAPSAEVRRRPVVMTAFMTCMSTDDEPCRPKGMTFHSNWPS
jgi:hypothetical protein